MWDGKILVLQRLKGQEFMSAAQLAGLWGVSEKTVRVRLKEMKPEIQRHGGELISKKGRGFLIRETDREAFEQWMGQLKAGEKDGIPDNPADRIEYLLAMLLNRQDYIKFDDICQFLYVSRSTLTAEMRQENWQPGS